MGVVQHKDALAKEPRATSKTHSTRRRLGDQLSQGDILGLCERSKASDQGQQKDELFTRSVHGGVVVRAAAQLFVCAERWQT